jgi:hypothetical protein
MHLIEMVLESEHQKLRNAMAKAPTHFDSIFYCLFVVSIVICYSLCIIDCELYIQSM